MQKITRWWLWLALVTVCAPAAQANVLGSDTQTFTATTNGLDFVTVHSSETLKPGIFNLGLFVNYAANTLPYFVDEAEEHVDDRLFSADFNMGVGLWKDLDVGISFPYVLKQVIDSDSARGEFSQPGNTEVRANIKYRLFGTDSYGMAFIYSINVNRLENNPFVGTGGGPTNNYELALDTSFWKIAAAINVGFRDRKPGTKLAEFPIEPLEDQYIASGALSYLFTSIDTKLIYEVFGSVPTEKVDSDIGRKQGTAETLLGIKHDVTEATALHFGAGREFADAIASPDWRVYAGINMTLGPMFKEKKPKIVKQKPAPEPEPEAEPEPEPSEPPMMAEETETPVKQEAGPGDEVFVVREINFLFDSHEDVLAGAKGVMQELADRFKDKGYTKLIIEGHTDSMGEDAYNIKLGAKRAISVRAYMVKVLGLDPAKIKAVTFGERKPIADNGNYQGRQLNRRVVFRVFYKEGWTQ
jgi:outer membrane protein OmpA-like peptidoglycan-associated protein